MRVPGGNDALRKLGTVLVDWTKDGDYCLRSGDYRIAKALSQDAWKYTLIRSKQILGHYTTSEQAKSAASEHEEGGNG